MNWWINFKCWWNGHLWVVCENVKASSDRGRWSKAIHCLRCGRTTDFYTLTGRK